MCNGYPKELEGTGFVQKHDPSNFCWIHLECGDTDPCFEEFIDKPVFVQASLEF